MVIIYANLKMSVPPVNHELHHFWVRLSLRRLRAEIRSHLCDPSLGPVFFRGGSCYVAGVLPGPPNTAHTGCRFAAVLRLLPLLLGCQEHTTTSAFNFSFLTELLSLLPFLPCSLSCLVENSLRFLLLCVKLSLMRITKKKIKHCWRSQELWWLASQRTIAPSSESPGRSPLREPRVSFQGSWEIGGSC